MTIHDSHCHSIYSGDVDKTRGASIDGMYARACELGLGSLAVTDHLEIDQLMGNVYPPLDNEGIRRDITAAREKYAGKVEVIYGVELAQPCHDLEKAEKLLSEYKHDFIVGSVHRVREFPDYSDMEYENMSDAMLKRAWDLYLVEMKELIEYGNIDTLAHITYPYRYFHRNGREHVIKVFENGREMFEPILKRIIEKGICLEVNTSGLRQRDGTTFPQIDLIRFYRELGGEHITVGSDAHYACDIGADIGNVYALLKEIGFDHICTFRERKPVYRDI